MSRVLAVVGATGTGKSALANALAVHLGGEVISADSMQVYRGMDIGTAKTPPAERTVPHHCLDLVDPGFPFTAALYQRAARAAIESALERGAVPIVCGGTGLYIRAALDDFTLDEDRERESADDKRENEGAHEASSGEPSGEPAAQRRLADDNSTLGVSRQRSASEKRSELNRLADELGAETFHALLAERDPESAALIHPHNVRRVVRAFEFLEQGASYAQQHEGFATYSAVYPVTFLGITVERALLYEVINRRVDAMLSAGLLAEVQALLAAGFREGATAQQAIGYKELVPVLDGTRSQHDAIEEIKQSTRHYAKRQ
ncbi:MAG: tRNA (adenosine(37)-N6)-dimethylallyltransferase MiaA, partial [Coriobacteriales bacterium]|nr:tRNA (adenosine(37)-N6)-dimethylallyltransferase MiaA [Coriobacteriales bacterium]